MFTALHEACYLGVPEVCELLLSVKANVDALSSLHLQTQASLGFSFRFHMAFT